MNQPPDSSRATDPQERPRPRPRPRIRGARPAPRPAPSRRDSNRETIESVVIAFVLAFLFRTFEAEAFVIPTGSMAPTLMGRHKDIACDACGEPFTVGATDDAVASAICPNCRFRNDVSDEPAFKGDRILVLKSLYDLPAWAPDQLREPHRWDVVVFKFPEDPPINYIKRLVGLPGEEIRIQYGNVFARSGDSPEFKILKKSPEKQRVMRMTVFNNNHQPAAWRENGWPPRWQPETPDGWRASADGKSFDTSEDAAASDAWAGLTYHHLVRVWGREDAAEPPAREQLITDFYGYNSGAPDDGFRPFDGEQQPRWVGDLSLSLTAEVREASGALRIELVRAGETFRCDFDLASGECRLYRGDQLLGRAQDAIHGTGRHAIAFSNIDDRLTVRVGNRLPFGDGVDYDGPKLGESQLPTAADLRPVTVASRGSRVRVSDLVLYRDIYYTHGANDAEYSVMGADTERMLSDPHAWGAIAQARISQFPALGPDDFMMFGDNSPRSRDGRLWERGAEQWLGDLARERNLPLDTVREQVARKPGGDIVDASRHVVRRQLLIGKAFFVYWPHGVPFGPHIDVPLGPLGTFRVPFYPNVARMKKIR
jgi:signal peptidase I